MLQLNIATKVRHMTDGGAFKEGGEDEASGERGGMQREELLFDAIWQVCLFGRHG